MNAEKSEYYTYIYACYKYPDNFSVGFVRVDLRSVCTTNSMKQHNCYSGTEACFIDSQLDKNSDNKNYNEPVALAHKFCIKKEKQITVRKLEICVGVASVWFVISK